MMKLTLSRFALATALITGAVATSVQASGLSSSNSAANMQVAQLHFRGGATSPRVAPPPRSVNNFGTRQRNTTAAPKRKKDQIRTGASSFGPATRGFAHSFRPNPHTGAKYIDGRFLKAEDLRSDVKSKAKYTNGYIKLQVKRGSSLTTTAPAKGISMSHNFVMLKKDF